MMQSLEVTVDPPAQSELDALAEDAKRALALLRSDDCEVRQPLFIEFAGMPKSGKSTIIGILTHFLRRMGFDVIQPVEGASLRTPAALRDDWLAFNAWSGCYSLRHIIELAHEQRPSEIVILDRGLFDASAWMAFLESSQQRITPEDRDKITAFLTLDLWRRREIAVFLFTVDRDSSLRREVDSKLVDEHGSVMNPDVLQSLEKAYRTTAEELKSSFPLWLVDTSYIDGQSPCFQGVAYKVGRVIVDKLNDLVSQRLLVTQSVEMEGLVTDEGEAGEVFAAILNGGNPQFLDRAEAERSTTVQQVVPYAFLVDQDGNYFRAKRRADHPRSGLRAKYTILVGGHAEEKDWNDAEPESVFECCLRRELEEELIGIRVQDIERVGLINDRRSPVGNRHLAVLFRVQVGGQPKIRRQASDQEFGREAVSWVAGEEIKGLIDQLDPWSQHVAASLFGADLPELSNEPTLFTHNNDE